jgi:hypothetical protein
MMNLAGNKDADVQIRHELERAMIPVVIVELGRTEVPFTLTGRLGEFRFTRGWRYWVVRGPVPLGVAVTLYADPVGKTDIRVGGDCGCPAPSEYATWLTEEGKEVIPTDTEELYRRHPATVDFATIVFSDDPTSLGAQLFITSYHIDTEVGLRIFTDAIRTHILTPAGIRPNAYFGDGHGRH